MDLLRVNKQVFKFDDIVMQRGITGIVAHRYPITVDKNLS